MTIRLFTGWISSIQDQAVLIGKSLFHETDPNSNRIILAMVTQGDLTHIEIAAWTWLYCIWGISKTTAATSDVYCQSINDNHNGTSCTFYVESVQVQHRGELGREYRKKEWDITDWGERERTSVEGERAAWVLKRSQHLVDFDRWSKST